MWEKTNYQSLQINNCGKISEKVGEKVILLTKILEIDPKFSSMGKLTFFVGDEKLTLFLSESRSRPVFVHQKLTYLEQNERPT